MSTRSMIGRLNPDGSVDGIYCHWDGYPEHNGKILIAHYNTPERVEELLDLGNLSALGAEIGEQQDFNDPKDGWCLAYGRDRGEDGQDARHFTNVYEFMTTRFGVDYIYLYTEGKWRCYAGRKEIEI